MTKNYLTECRLSIMWDDGQLEQMSIFDLPDDIKIKLTEYFVDLETLRNKDKQAYDNEYLTYTRETSL